tara:strand:+ start:720 stop:1580 length:861 start_codon:yes stop_codon:yes gene_type:complete
MLYSWLLVYPASWLITAGALTALLAPEALMGGIDSMQMLCAYGFLFTRRLIVAVKYGYFDLADFNALSQPAPEWSFTKSTKRLIAVGWGKPKQFPGLIRSEVELAERSAGITLDNLQMSADLGTRATLKDATLTILDEAYSKELPKSTNGIIVLSVLSILTGFLITKWQSGAPLIGATLQMQLINLGTYTAVLSGMGIMGFGLICALEFSRRQKRWRIWIPGYLITVPRPGMNEGFLRSLILGRRMIYGIGLARGLSSENSESAITCVFKPTPLSCFAFPSSALGF